MGRPVPDLSGVVQHRGPAIDAIRSIAHETFGTRTIVRSVAVERIERRLLRYSVRLGNESTRWNVVGKVYDDQPDGQRGFDVMRRLGESGFSQRPPTNVHVPRAYGYLPDLRLLLMEHAPGETLKRLVKKKRARAADMQLFAAALLKLHRAPLVVTGSFRVADHLAIRCAGLHEALAEAFPQLGERVRWIVEQARERETRSTPAMTLVHGDFHFGQVHVEDGEVWILDLDPVHLGDPAYDIAMVFVMLKRLEQTIGDAAYVRSLRDAFFECYFADLPGLRPAARVPLHMALIHLKRACKRFRWQDEPGWRDTIRRQINEGVACMEIMRFEAVPHSVSDVADLYSRCPATT